MEIAVNYMAVVASAVAAMVLGFLWYGPLFGKQWKALMGFNEVSMKSMPLSATQAMAAGTVTALITAYVLAVTLGISEVAFGPLEIAMAMQGAFWLWLGFIATTQLGIVLWEGKPWKLFFLNAFQSLVSIEIMAVIIALWR